MKGAHSEFAARIAADIATHGWAISIGCTCLRPDKVVVSHTIGLHKFGLPELVLTVDAPHEIIGMMLNGTAMMIVDKVLKADDGEIIEGFAASEYNATLRELPDTIAVRDAIALADQYYGEKVRVLHVVIEDDKHKYPWDRGCDAEMSRTQSCLTDWTAERRH
jgi:hypothetical protein